MRPAFRLALLAAVVASASGCRFKGYESFRSATTPRPDFYKDRQFGESAPKDSVAADWGKYSNGGIADASGGLNPQTRYGTGARQTGSVLPGYDQPQKGSGQQKGEYPNAAAPGYGQTNAPAFQPSPSDVGG